MKWNISNQRNKKRLITLSLILACCVCDPPVKQLACGDELGWIRLNTCHPNLQVSPFRAKAADKHTHTHARTQTQMYCRDSPGTADPLSDSWVRSCQEERCYMWWRGTQTSAYIWQTGDGETGEDVHTHFTERQMETVTEGTGED